MLKRLAKARDKLIPVPQHYDFRPAEHRKTAQLIQHIRQLSPFPVHVDPLRIFRKLRQDLPQLLRLQKRIRANQGINRLNHRKLLLRPPSEPVNDTGSSSTDQLTTDS